MIDLSHYSSACFNEELRHLLENLIITGYDTLKTFGATAQETISRQSDSDEAVSTIKEILHTSEHVVRKYPEILISCLTYIATESRNMDLLHHIRHFLDAPPHKLPNGQNFLHIEEALGILEKDIASHYKQISESW